MNTFYKGKNCIVEIKSERCERTIYTDIRPFRYMDWEDPINLTPVSELPGWELLTDEEVFLIFL